MIQDILPHSFDNHYLADKKIKNNDFLLHFKANTLLMKISNEAVDLPRMSDFRDITDTSNITFLYTLNDVSGFILWDEAETVEGDFEYKEIGFFRTIPQKEIGWISVVGLHLRNWYIEHRFCGKCGAETYHKSD